MNIKRKFRSQRYSRYFLDFLRGCFRGFFSFFFFRTIVVVNFNVNENFFHIFFVAFSFNSVKIIFTGILLLNSTVNCLKNVGKSDEKIRKNSRFFMNIKQKFRSQLYSRNFHDFFRGAFRGVLCFFFSRAFVRVNFNINEKKYCFLFFLLPLLRSIL